MLEGDIFNVRHKIVLARVKRQLLENFDQHQAEQELDGQVSFFGGHVSFGGARGIVRFALGLGSGPSLVGRGSRRGGNRTAAADADLPLVPRKQGLQQRGKAVLGHGTKGSKQLVKWSIFTPLQRFGERFLLEILRFLLCNLDNFIFNVLYAKILFLRELVKLLIYETKTNLLLTAFIFYGNTNSRTYLWFSHDCLNFSFSLHGELGEESSHDIFARSDVHVDVHV
jgi:hypothetical protein